MKKNDTLATINSIRKKQAKMQRKIDRLDLVPTVAREQGIEDESDFSEWSNIELPSINARLDGLYVLAMKGSKEALEWLYDEAYGESRTGIPGKYLDDSRHLAQKYLMMVTSRSLSSADYNYLSAEYLELLGDYHLGLLGDVMGANTPCAYRFYSLAIERYRNSQENNTKDDPILTAKKMCATVLTFSGTPEQLAEVENDMWKHDFSAYTVARKYISLMISKKKKHGKKYKAYKEKVDICFKILACNHERYVNDLFAFAENSELF